MQGQHIATVAGGHLVLCGDGRDLLLQARVVRLSLPPLVLLRLQLLLESTDALGEICYGGILCNQDLSLAFAKERVSAENKPESGNEHPKIERRSIFT